MKGFLAKLCKRNGIAKRIFSLALSVLMMTSVLQALPVGVLVAHAEEGTEALTNITLHFNNNEWNWAEPAVQFYTNGTATNTTASGYASGPTQINEWGDGATGYAMQDDGNGWYSITLKGDFDGLQLISDMSASNDEKNTVSNAYKAEMANYKEETPKDLYFNTADQAWYLEASYTTPLVAATNLKIHFNNNECGWTQPALHYWGGSLTITNDNGEVAGNAIPGWGASDKGYLLADEGNGWYTITIKGDYENLQFLDLSAPNNNTGGVSIDKIKAYKNSTAQELYFNPGNKEWYFDSAMTNSLTPSNINIHFKNVHSWTQPALHYWGGAPTITSDGQAVTGADIAGWSAGDKGYVLKDDGDGWFSISVKGDYTNIQFLDLSAPSNNTGGIAIDKLKTYKNDTAQDVYFNPADKWWYSDSAMTTPLIPKVVNNITLHFDNSTNSYGRPALHYWGGAPTILANGNEVEGNAITGWGASDKGYLLNDDGNGWFSITVKGDFTNLQFLDLDEPSNNTGGVAVDEMKAFVSDTTKDLYFNRADQAWYLEAAYTTPLVAPPAFTEQTVIVHFKNTENWEDVAAYIGNSGSFKALTHAGETVYAYAGGANWPGALIEADPETANATAGWYSFKLVTDPCELGIILNNSSSSQTANITYTPDKATTELFVTLTGATDGDGHFLFNVTEDVPEGWVTNTTEVKAPKDPNAELGIESPIVSADNKVTFNYVIKDGITSIDLMGGLSSWDFGKGIALTKDEDKGVFTYTTTAAVAPGIYEYKFIKNNDKTNGWMPDPLCKLTSGEGNSIVVVPGLSNAEVTPEKGIETDLPATLKLYTAGQKETTDVAVTYTLDDATLASVVTIDNDAHKITVDKTCTSTEFTLTAKSGDLTSKMYVRPQDKLYTYNIYYYDPTPEHMATDKAELWMWANDGASITTPTPFTSVETLSDGRGWLKAEIKTPSLDIGFKARSVGDWTWQTGTDYKYQNTEKADSSTLYFVYGVSGTYDSIDKIEMPKERYVLVSYTRSDNDYVDDTKGWNFYSWTTGYGDETEIYPVELNGEQIMKAKVRDQETDFTLAFIIRQSEKDKSGNKWLAKDGGDIYTTFPGDQEVVKIYVEEGKGVVKTLPYNKSYEIDSATDTITFYYRDDETLARTNSAQLAEDVKVVVKGTEYAMTYDAENERYFYALTNCEDGTYPFSYKVGSEEIEDKFASNGTVTYKSFDDLSIVVSLSQSTMDYNDNNVLTVSFAGADASKVSSEDVESITANLSALGLSSKFAIAPELMEGTISVDRDVALGSKNIPVTLKDVYGNTYTATTSVEVVARDEDAFDWDEAVIYMTCTDRFFDGNTENNGAPADRDDLYSDRPVDKEANLGYHGGDFAGLKEKLDYLKDLGVNTIWITPIVENSNTADDNGYHGYWASDFTKLSSYLGTEEEFAALLDAAHARDMKIMVDVVLNHAGYGTEDYFNGLIAGTTMIRDEDHTISGDDIRSNANTGGLPDFMTEDPVVRDQLIEWQVDWMTKYEIDYYRVDTVKHVENLTWQAFKNELTKENPDFKIIGEYYGAGYGSTGGALGTGAMDSLLDFDSNDKATDFVTGSISSAEKFFVNRNASISNYATLGGFLSSHDEDSFVDHLISEKGKTEAEALALAKVAASLQITAKGQVVIYCGEEIGQHGLNNWPIQSNRYDFDWTEAEAQNGATNSMLTHYQKMLEIRENYSGILSKGTRTTIAANDTNGYDVFKRTSDEGELFVALNIKSAAQGVSFATGAADGTIYTDLYGGGTYKVASGNVTVSIPAAENGGTVVLVKTGYEAPVTPTTPSTSATPETSEDTTETTTTPSTGTTTEDATEVEVNVETNAETTVPDVVEEVTPVVDSDVQDAVKEETEQILEDILNDELAEDVVDEETLANIKEAQENGIGILTQIIMDAVAEDTVEETVKEALQSALVESVKDVQNAKVEIVQYLDLSLLMKTTEGQALGKINKLSKPLKVTFAVPEGWEAPGRDIVVLRMHNGLVDILNTVLNADGTRSFETDRFSTYAVAFVDKEVEEDTDAPTTDADDSADTTGPENVVEDDSNGTLFIVIGIIIVLLVAAFIIFLALKGKKNK